MKKFLICRPKGGLNDTLVQIEKCWLYSKKFKRVLIIDSKLSGLHEEFSYFFETDDDEVLLNLSDDLLNDLNLKKCYPKIIEGRLDKYKSIYSEYKKNHVDDESETILTFDFDKDYEECLIVHDQCGGGTESLNLLKRLKLKSLIKEELYKSLDKIGKDYIGIHVRNTDYKTDYINFFNEIEKDVENSNILICSDSLEVITYAKSFFKSSNVMTSSDTPDTQGLPLHSIWTNINNRNQISVNSIVDLIALSLSSRLLYSNLTRGHLSGFTKLAKLLNEDKSIIYNILNSTSSS